MQNRVFFPQAALDQWIVDGTADLQKGELTLLGDVGRGRRYGLEEAVHVLREVSGAGDGPKLIGRVKTRAWLQTQGGEIVETSMLLGDAAYDVEPGWVGVPIGPFAEHLLSRVGKTSQSGSSDPGPRSDEELLTKLTTRRA